MSSSRQKKEWDIRDGRFESAVSQEQLSSPYFAAQRKFMCSKCHRMWEQKSRHCPKCDTRTMGELRPLNPTAGERERSIARARAGRGASLPEV